MKKYTALILLTVVLSGLIIFGQAFTHQQALKDRDAQWRKAVQPIFDARGISPKDAGPREVRRALDANTGYHRHETWKWSATKAPTVIQIRRVDRMW